MPYERRRLAALALLVALIAAACGSGSATTQSASVPIDLEGEFATLDGSTIDLASLEGEDVVLWFWAPW